MGLFFVTHFIADFIFQSRTMGKKKSENIGYLALHLLIIFLMFVGAGFAVFYQMSGNAKLSFVYAVVLSVVNATVHGLIDWNIWSLYKLSVYMRYKNDQNFDKEKYEYWNDSWFYGTIGLDQLLHGLTIIVLYGWI